MMNGVKIEGNTTKIKIKNKKPRSNGELCATNRNMTGCIKSSYMHLRSIRTKFKIHFLFSSWDPEFFSLTSNSDCPVTDSVMDCLLGGLLSRTTLVSLKEERVFLSYQNTLKWFAEFPRVLYILEDLPWFSCCCYLFLKECLAVLNVGISSGILFIYFLGYSSPSCNCHLTWSLYSKLWFPLFFSCLILVTSIWPKSGHPCFCSWRDLSPGFDWPTIFQRDMP